jgi:hypothetical protein
MDVFCIMETLREAILMSGLGPTAEFLSFARQATRMWRMPEMQEQFSAKRKKPKKRPPHIPNAVKLSNKTAGSHPVGAGHACDRSRLIAGRARSYHP